MHFNSLINFFDYFNPLYILIFLTSYGSVLIKILQTLAALKIFIFLIVIYYKFLGFSQCVTVAAN
jgi:hypothetical protein